MIHGSPWTLWFWTNQCRSSWRWLEGADSTYADVNIQTEEDEGEAKRRSQGSSSCTQVPAQLEHMRGRDGERKGRRKEAVVSRYLGLLDVRGGAECGEKVP